MQKNPRKVKEIKVSRSKGKKKRNPTACVDKKRDGHHCAICGSEEIVCHGIIFCNHCGNEKEFLVPQNEFLYGIDFLISSVVDDMKLPCHTNKNCRLFYIHKKIVAKCLACNSVWGPKCPNCKRTHWTDPFGKKHCCLHCGFKT